jgi:hypothetical protein
MSNFGKELQGEQVKDRLDIAKGIIDRIDRINKG